MTAWMPPKPRCRCIDTNTTCACTAHDMNVYLVGPSVPEETPFDVALKQFEKEFRARPPKRRKCPPHKQYACQVPGCR